MDTVDIITLGVLTAANVWFNWWISLREKRFHGILRFVSFECVILLVWMNYPVWFLDALSARQLVSWLLLALCTLVAATGFVVYYSKGKPEDHKEKTTQLITTGIYRYIRHPLYLSLILGGFGIMLKDPGWLQLVLSLVNFSAVFLTARVEEKEMIRKFGDSYRDYMKDTRMFFPFIY